jgi:hypothetical protein
MTSPLAVLVGKARAGEHATEECAMAVVIAAILASTREREATEPRGTRSHWATHRGAASRRSAIQPAPRVRQ